MLVLLFKLKKAITFLFCKIVYKITQKNATKKLYISVAIPVFFFSKKRKKTQT